MFDGSGYQYISIHAPREGGDYKGHIADQQQQIISIHAPREGGDRTNYHPHNENSISIHAPREGGDRVSRLFDKLR